MGFTAREIDALSLWEFAAMAVGFARANGGKVQDQLTQQDADDLGAMLDKKPAWER